jgi:ABC-type xylose transport system permease subunit
VNAILVARVGIPSLVVTLAMLIGFRGLARILVEDNSMGNFPTWFTDLGQKGIVGPIPVSILLFFVLLVLLGMTLHRSSFGRQVIVIGTNAEVARFSGLNVARVSDRICPTAKRVGRWILIRGISSDDREVGIADRRARRGEGPLAAPRDCGADDALGVFR